MGPLEVFLGVVAELASAAILSMDFDLLTGWSSGSATAVRRLDPFLNNERREPDRLGGLLDSVLPVLFFLTRGILSF